MAKGIDVISDTTGKQIQFQLWRIANALEKLSGSESSPASIDENGIVTQTQASIDENGIVSIPSASIDENGIVTI